MSPKGFDAWFLESLDQWNDLSMWLEERVIFLIFCFRHEDGVEDEK